MTNKFSFYENNILTYYTITKIIKNTINYSIKEIYINVVHIIPIEYVYFMQYKQSMFAYLFK